MYILKDTSSQISSYSKLVAIALLRVYLIINQAKINGFAHEYYQFH